MTRRPNILELGEKKADHIDTVDPMRTLYNS
jgi:hypothetical protein